MSLKNIRPLGNRILIKRSEPIKMKGSIFIPDSAKEKPKQGEVVAVGPGQVDKTGKLQMASVQKGDHVLFTAYAGTEVKTDDNDHDYLIVSEEDILGILGVN